MHTDARFGSGTTKYTPLHATCVQRSGWIAAGLSCLALTAPATSRAQDGADVLEVITVTAQKRERDQQDVGLSITTFSAAQLEAPGLANTMDIAAQVPDMQVQSFSPGARDGRGKDGHAARAQLRG
jgi:outer membrane receptor protein involved in Fe transport